MGASSSFTARAYWATGPGTGELRPVVVRPPGPGEVMVRALYGGISRGSEALVALGRVPASQRQAMRAPFQEGEFPFPVKYGYSSVGGGVWAASGALFGQTVFCLLPTRRPIVVPSAAVVPLPEGVPAAGPCSPPTLETALNAAGTPRPCPGERIHRDRWRGAWAASSPTSCGRLPGAEVTLADSGPSGPLVAGGAGDALPCGRRGAGDAELVCARERPRPQGPAAALAARRPRGRGWSS